MFRLVRQAFQKKIITFRAFFLALRRRSLVHGIIFRVYCVGQLITQQLDGPLNNVVDIDGLGHETSGHDVHNGQGGFRGPINAVQSAIAIPFLLFCSVTLKKFKFSFLMYEVLSQLTFGFIGFRLIPSLMFGSKTVSNRTSTLRGNCKHTLITTRPFKQPVNRKRNYLTTLATYVEQFLYVSPYAPKSK